MSSLLETDSIRKSFGNRQVLTDIHMHCRTGDIIGLLGRNGSGKSTLLQIIFGTLNAEKFIRIDGKTIEHAYKSPGLIGYLPQQGFLPKQLSMEKAAALYFGKEKAGDFLNDPLLEPLRKNKTGELSGGELRYFEIKLLLCSSYKFVLLDEPFNGVAPLLVEILSSLIKENSPGKGIILTDHDYRNVLNTANKYCLLYDGGIKEIKDKSDLVKWAYLPG